MMRRWIARQGWGLLVGVGLTAAATVAYLLGVSERLELLGYDFHVRHFSRIPASDRILHVDIGDDALNRVGSWPWPRDMQAELVRVLHELGARQIVMDIVFSEPKPAEMRLPAADRYADIEGEIDVLGELSQENMVFPDDELAQAVADSGNVCLAMYYEEPAGTDEHSGLRHRMAALLRKDFGLDAAVVAQSLSETTGAVDAVLAGVKRRVAEERVAAVLQERPSATAAEVYAAIIPSVPFDRQTADRADVLAAYHRQLSLNALRDKCEPVPAGLLGKIPKAQRVIPPLYKLTRGAGAVGFVTFGPDMDGCTRHVPLVVEWEGRLIEQLGLRAARDLLGIRLDDLAIDAAGNLVIAARADRPGMRIQLDDRGQVLLNWHVRSRRWAQCFEHLPVARVLAISDCRRGLRENNTRRELAIAQAMQLVMDESAFDAYRQDVNTMLAGQRQVRWATLQGRGDDEDVKRLAAEAARLREVLERQQKETLAHIRESWTELKSEPDPQDPEIADDYRRFRQASHLIDGFVAELEEANRAIEEQQNRLIGQLRPIVSGRTCFVGYTATAVADMVTTPAYERMPGVLVHSTLFNSLIVGESGEFRTWSGGLVQVAVIMLIGIVISAVTATLSPRTSLALVIVIISVSFALSALVVFARMDHWLRLVTAWIVVFVVWAIMVLFRFLVTDRQRRRFSKAVAQYVSPAMARRIADEARRLDLSPANGMVTCYFSDLAGFTPISERLGPEGTKSVLNPYLEAMSAVLHRHDALINKFMGDGVFAFFNAPILPCASHQLAACEAALDSQRALRELAERYAGHPLAREFAGLSMRIGLASGPVFVGDYGSENKLDYTCVGDTVNLAARLESANKQFGTSLMLAEGTRSAAGDRFAYRYLGALQVKGQSVGVRVYELLGHSGEIQSEAVDFAGVFGTAAESFARRDWDKASATFDQCLRLRPGDPGAGHYLAAIRAFRREPPPEDWNGALELREK